MWCISVCLVHILAGLWWIPYGVRANLGLRPWAIDLLLEAHHSLLLQPTPPTPIPLLQHSPHPSVDQPRELQRHSHQGVKFGSFSNKCKMSCSSDGIKKTTRLFGLNDTWLGLMVMGMWKQVRSVSIPTVIVLHHSLQILNTNRHSCVWKSALCSFGSVMQNTLYRNK